MPSDSTPQKAGWPSLFVGSFAVSGTPAIAHVSHERQFDIGDCRPLITTPVSRPSVSSPVASRHTARCLVTGLQAWTAGSVGNPSLGMFATSIPERRPAIDHRAEGGNTPYRRRPAIVRPLGERRHNPMAASAPASEPTASERPHHRQGTPASARGLLSRTYSAVHRPTPRSSSKRCRTTASSSRARDSSSSSRRVIGRARSRSARTF